MVAILPAQLGLPGGPELLLILGIAVLLFGANKLPALARSSGQAMGEFRKGREDVEAELRASVAAGETEAAGESAAVDRTAHGATTDSVDERDGLTESE